MTKIKITLFETHQHVVEIESPAYFKIVNDKIAKYFKVYEMEGRQVYDKISFYDGRLSSYLCDMSQDSESTSGVIIEEYEYINKLIDVQEHICLHVEHKDFSEEQYMDEDEAREDFLEAADIAYDQAKYQEFEKKNFHDVTRGGL